MGSDWEDVEEKLLLGIMSLLLIMTIGLVVFGVWTSAEQGVGAEQKETAVVVEKKDVPQKEETITSTQEKVDSGDKIDKEGKVAEGIKGVKSMLVWLVVAIAMVTILASVHRLLENILEDSIGERGNLTMKSKYSGVKIKKKETGSQSAKTVLRMLRYLEDIRIEMVWDKQMIHLIQLSSKLEKMLDVYQWDTKEFGMDMYKYQSTFESMEETMKKAYGMGRLFEKETLDKLSESVNYPFEEMVQEHGKKYVHGVIDMENSILRDLHKQ